MEEMHTIKEWAKLAQVELINCNGFINFYNILTNNDNTQKRLYNAGEFICTRRVFEAGLFKSNICFPKIADYANLVKVIPSYSEKKYFLPTEFLYKLDGLDDEIIKLHFKKLLASFDLLRNIRKTNIILNGSDKVNLKVMYKSKGSLDTYLDDNMRRILLKNSLLHHIKTVEDMEEFIYEIIVKEINELMDGAYKDEKRLKKFDDLLYTYNSLKKESYRNRDITREEIEKGIMLVNISLENNGTISAINDMSRTKEVSNDDDIPLPKFSEKYKKEKGSFFSSLDVVESDSSIKSDDEESKHL